MCIVSYSSTRYFPQCEHLPVSIFAGTCDGLLCYFSKCDSECSMSSYNELKASPQTGHSSSAEVTDSTR